MTMLPIKTAARQLAIPPGTLRRYCKQGMPHQPGGRGRGNAQLVDPAVVRQWIGAPADDRAVLTLADELQRLLAASVWKSWKSNVKLNHRREATLYAAIWYQCATDMLDRLRKLNSEVPDVESEKSYPPEIQQLLKIARGD